MSVAKPDTTSPLIGGCRLGISVLGLVACEHGPSGASAGDDDSVCYVNPRAVTAEDEVVSGRNAIVALDGYFGDRDGTITWFPAVEQVFEVQPVPGAEKVRLEWFVDSSRALVVERRPYKGVNSSGYCGSTLEIPFEVSLVSEDGGLCDRFEGAGIIGYQESAKLPALDLFFEKDAMRSPSCGTFEVRPTDSFDTDAVDGPWVVTAGVLAPDSAGAGSLSLEYRWSDGNTNASYPLASIEFFE